MTAVSGFAAGKLYTHDGYSFTWLDASALQIVTNSALTTALNNTSLFCRRGTETASITQTFVNSAFVVQLPSNSSSSYYFRVGHSGGLDYIKCFYNYFYSKFDYYYFQKTSGSNLAVFDSSTCQFVTGNLNITGTSYSTNINTNTGQISNGKSNVVIDYNSAS